MKIHPSSPKKPGFLLMEVILALFIFTIIATSFTKAIGLLWRNTSFVKEELVISQILDSALQEVLHLQQLEEGSTEVFVPERDVTLESVVYPLELENIDGNLVSEMWEIVITARYQQDGINQERSVRGWRYLPLYRL